jgi:hypothetical protein
MSCFGVEPAKPELPVAHGWGATSAAGTSSRRLQYPSKNRVDFRCFSRTSVKSARCGNCHQENALAPEVAQHQLVHDRATFAFNSRRLHQSLASLVDVVGAVVRRASRAFGATWRAQLPLTTIKTPPRSRAIQLDFPAASTIPPRLPSWGPASPGPDSSNNRIAASCCRGSGACTAASSARSWWPASSWTAVAGAPRIARCNSTCAEACGHPA